MLNSPKFINNSQTIDFTIQNQQTPQLDDHVIWERFKKGDDQSLVYIYRTYSESLYTYGCQFSNRTEFVRDCIQELFYELIDKRRKLSTANSIKGYLFASIKRKIIRGLKEEEKVAFKENGFDFSFIINTHSMTSTFDKDDSALIESKLNKLPIAQKEVILLHFYEGLGYPEIAEIMHIKVKSARALTYRALESLAAELSSFKTTFYSILLLIVSF